MPRIVDNFAEYNEKSVQLYDAVHEYAAAGYSNRAIAKELHCSRNTVRKYLYGDYESLCRRNYRSGLDQFYDYIIKALSAGISRKDVYDKLIQKGYKGKLTAAYDYMNKIIKIHQINIAVHRSSTAESIQKKKEIQKYDHITRSGIFRFLWMGMELTAAHKEYLMKTYPQLRELKACVCEFREIYE